MSDQYEEQARDMLGAFAAGGMTAKRLAAALRTAAEDATRRERSRVFELLRARGADESDGMARRALYFASNAVIAANATTPPPPRPATGEAKRWRCSCVRDSHTDAMRSVDPDCELHGFDYEGKPTPPARTEHASEHATSHVGSKPARTEDGGRCDGEDESGRPCGGCHVHTPPPEPEAARCERVVCPTCAGRKVVDTGRYIGRCNDCEGKGSKPRCRDCKPEAARVAALVEAARAVVDASARHDSDRPHPNEWPSLIAALRAALAGVDGKGAE